MPGLSPPLSVVLSQGLKLEHVVVVWYLLHDSKCRLLSPQMGIKPSSGGSHRDSSVYTTLQSWMDFWRADYRTTGGKETQAGRQDPVKS